MTTHQTASPGHRRTARRIANIIAAAALLLSTVGCVGEPARPGAGGPGPVASRPGVPRLPSPTPTAPLPTGRTAGTAAAFDRDPCGVLTSDELRAALAEPFHVLSGNVLQAEGRPAPAAGRTAAETDTVGCGFGFVAEGTDVAETFHSMVIRVARWRTGGATLLSNCRTAAKAPPLGSISLGDEACLGAGPVLTIRTGAVYVTVAVLVQPPRADRSQEDAELAPLVRATATLVVPRLPSSP